MDHGNSHLEDLDGLGPLKCIFEALVIVLWYYCNSELIHEKVNNIINEFFGNF